MPESKLLERGPSVAVDHVFPHHLNGALLMGLGSLAKRDADTLGWFVLLGGIVLTAGERILMRFLPDAIFRHRHHGPSNSPYDSRRPLPRV